MPGAPPFGLLNQSNSIVDNRQYFVDLGYEPANRQTTPDFLVTVTDPANRIPRSDMSGAPRNADEFARAFSASEIGKLNVEDMRAYEQDRVDKPELALAYMQSAQADHATTARKSS